MDELKFLDNLFPKLTADESVVIGPGDDCAAVKWDASTLQLLAVDQVVANQHFTIETAPERVGRKLLARNLSDIAAMGGVPRYALATVAADKTFSQDYHSRVMDGLLQLGKEFGVHVIGGDVCGLPNGYNATLTIVGEVAQDLVVTRGNAQVGDFIFTTGVFGDTFLSEHHLDFVPRVKEGQWLAKNMFASAMMDVSDGILMDLGRLAKASKVDVELNSEAVLPRRSGLSIKQILTDGEDYELLFTVPASKKEELESKWSFPIPLTCIGRVLNCGNGIIFNLAKENLTEKYEMFSHF